MANSETADLRRAASLPDVGTEIACKPGVERIDLGRHMGRLPAFAIDRPSPVWYHALTVMAAIRPVVVYIPNNGRILANSGPAPP